MSSQLDRIEQTQKDQTKAILAVEKTCGRMVSIIEGDEAASVDGFGKRIKNLEKHRKNTKLWRLAEAVGLAWLLAWLGSS